LPEKFISVGNEKSRERGVLDIIAQPVVNIKAW